MSLVAGKHVISEKPIAPTVGIATKLIEIYERFTSQIWMVAENFRYAATLVRAAELVRADSIGKPAIAGWTIYAGLGLGARNAGIIREG
jgi:predicted dehydrogenase